jgi:hypothetical protein
MSQPSPGYLIDTCRAIPPEHAITRRYVLPPGAAAEFIAELEDETEEPTPALRALLSGVALKIATIKSALKSS